MSDSFPVPRRRRSRPQLPPQVVHHPARQLRHIRFPPVYAVFLDMAKRFLGEGNFQMAVVAAQTACEVCAEQVLAAALRKQVSGPLAEQIAGLLQNHNLANDKVRKLYTTLTGDDIGQAKFWPKVRPQTELRNQVVHSGKSVERYQAADSIEIAEQMIPHLEGVLRKL